MLVTETVLFRPSFSGWQGHLSCLALPPGVTGGSSSGRRPATARLPSPGGVRTAPPIAESFAAYLPCLSCFPPSGKFPPPLSLHFTLTPQSPLAAA